MYGLCLQGTVNDTQRYARYANARYVWQSAYYCVVNLLSYTYLPDRVEVQNMTELLLRV